jgi:hypothetical protein
LTGATSGAPADGLVIITAYHEVKPERGSSQSGPSPTEVDKPRVHPAANHGVSQSMHQRTRMELISIATATSVYAPVPVALDPFVEDSHLVGLFVRRSARCGRGKARAGVDPPRTASLDRLACWTAEPSNQVRVLAESPKASLLQADHLISRAAAFACEQRRRPDCRRRARRLCIRPAGVVTTAATGRVLCHEAVGECGAGRIVAAGGKEWPRLGRNVAAGRGRALSGRADGPVAVELEKVVGRCD